MNLKLFLVHLLLVSGFLKCFSSDIIPKPNYVNTKEGFFRLSKNTQLVFTEEVSETIGIFQQSLSRDHGLSLGKLRMAPGRKGDRIIVYIDTGLLPALGEEGYTIDIDKSQIKVIGSSGKGAFYGLQSLRQLVMHASNTRSSDEGYDIPCLEIRDHPRFPWRGFMLDVSRHFFDAKVVMRLLDEMALLKLNVFHWHLTDDQGWRMPIGKYPKLISVGSRRDSSQTSVIRNENGEKVFTYDGKPHEGSYSIEEIREVISYAAKRHIKVVPEIDMPSHNQAAMAAYPWLSTTRKKSRVPTTFYGEPYHVNPAEINLADPNVVGFFKDVLDEVASVFPSDIIHIGGDEVWYDLWAQSGDIKAFMKKMGHETYADLQMWFSVEMSDYLEKKGKRAMAWNDILGGHLEAPDSSHIITVDMRPNRQSVISFWRGDARLMNHVAEQGYDIVNGHKDYTYFNQSYKAPSVEKSYKFDPVPPELSEKNRSRILGSSCHLWTELVPTEEKLYFQLFPRLATFAEVCWTNPSNKNFEEFCDNLPMLEKHWSKSGFNYYRE